MSWQHDRSMSPGHFNEVLKYLELSQAACARFLNLSSRQVARMQRGEAKVPVPVALLFSSMIEHDEKPIEP